MENINKKIILCADDFGISPGVNQGIINLAEKGHISATSVMVVYKNWNDGVEQLLEFRERLDIGLHFVLTDSEPVSQPFNISSLCSQDGFYTPKQVIFKSRKFHVKEIEKELAAQFQCFIEAFGFSPDYIDGHHNVHQYPLVRNVVVNFIKENNLSIYVRNTFAQWTQVLRLGKDAGKAFAVSWWGDAFKSLAQKSRIQTNYGFAGVYDLRRSVDFKDKFRFFLKFTHQKNVIIMTHPGIPDATLARRDVFCDGRQDEYDFMMSDEFLNILKQERVSLTRFQMEEAK